MIVRKQSEKNGTLGVVHFSIIIFVTLSKAVYFSVIITVGLVLIGVGNIGRFVQL